jgi:hypothetical protein
MKPLKWFASLDSSAKALLLSNLLTIVFAVAFGWSLMTMLWGYWLQSVIIGVFAFLQLLRMALGGGFSVPTAASSKHFTGAASSAIVIAPKAKSKQMPITTAFFFAFCYGFFHLIYAVFLSSFSRTDIFGGLLGFAAGFPVSEIQQQSPFPAFGSTDVSGILLMGLLFFSAHLYSFLKNYIFDKKETEPNITIVFFEPYSRILPMHLTIIFGGFIAMLSAGLGIGFAEEAILVLFMLLKTYVDIDAHNKKHKKDILPKGILEKAVEK